MNLSPTDIEVAFINADTQFLDKAGKLNTIPSADKKHDVACTIVIPCYNYGRFLPEAVSSALAQTVDNIEVIIVDDGSKDDLTKEVVRSYIGVEKVKVIIKENGGLSAARNSGIAEARGKYICCLDADDLIDPTYIERCIYEMESHENLGFVYTWVQLFGNENSVWQTRDFDIEEAIKENWTSVSAVFRRNDWHLVGGYDVRMAGGYEDWEFWLRLSQLGRAGRVIKAPLFFHRKHGITMTHTAKQMHDELVGRIIQFNENVYKNAEWRNRLAKFGQPRKRIARGLDLIKARQNERDKKTLLVILPWLKPGGAEVLMIDILKGLSSEYRFVVVTTLNDPHLLKEEFQKITTEIFHFSEGTTHDEFLVFVEYLIKSRNVNLILGSGNKRFYDSTSDFKKVTGGLPVVDILHNDSSQGHFLNAIRNSKYIDKHICVSEVISESCIREGISSEKVLSIHNGVDVNELFALRDVDILEIRRDLGIPHGRKVLCFVGRASQEKRPILFLELIKRIKLDQDIFGICVSSGYMLEEMREYIKLNNLEGDVKIIPDMPRGELWKVYQGSDFLVNTSTIEGMPLTALEALSLGCPVAAMSVGNLATIIKNGENGLIVSKDEFDSLVREICSFLNNEEELSMIRKKSRDSILDSDYLYARMINKYSETLSGCMKGIC